MGLRRWLFCSRWGPEHVAQLALWQCRRLRGHRGLHHNGRRTWNDKGTQGCWPHRMTALYVQQLEQLSQDRERGTHG